VVVTGGIAAAVAGYPVCELTTSTLLGVMVVANPLGSAYLGKLQRDQGAVSLAVVTPAGVLATAGAQPPAAEMESLAARVRATGTPVRAAGDRYLDVEPLAGGSRGAPPAVLVVSTTRATAIDQQDRTERALYLIALGGTLIALLFVAAVGDRMTMGLRRLTEVADRVRRGGIGERVAISSTDEVGTLGSAFDSMMASVEAHTAALQRAAEDETRLRNRLEAVVAGMGDALVATDASGAVTDFNAAAGALTGTSAGGARGRPATEVLEIRDEDGQPVDPLVLAAGGRRSLVGATVVAGGLRVPVAVSIGSLEGAGGESAGAVMVLRDLRREQEMERMKSEFLSRIGHELRTPLTAILGYAEILLRRSVPAEQARRWHGEIYDAGTRLRRIIELLEFVASAEAGRLAVHAEPVDPRELAREVAGSWSDRLPHDVQLQRRVARLTPPVRADRKWLTLAVNELIDNAVKFSPQGGKVALTARPAPGDGAVDISVTDRGMGMDPAQRRLAFGDFVQGDSSDTRRYGGLGLGLALVERVARAHGGTVLCESSPGHGSKFTIRLPAGGPPRSDN
jgi:PAS domain S-box-containing protein